MTYRFRTPNISFLSILPKDMNDRSLVMDPLLIHAKADAQGIAHIDVPIGSPNSEADMVVTVTNTAEPPLHYDFSSLAGRLQWKGDPVQEQRRLRDEW